MNERSSPQTRGNISPSIKVIAIQAAPAIAKTFDQYCIRPPRHKITINLRVVELFCRLSPWGLSNSTPQPRRSSRPLLCLGVPCGQVRSAFPVLAGIELTTIVNHVNKNNDRRENFFSCQPDLWWRYVKSLFPRTFEGSLST